MQARAPGGQLRVHDCVHQGVPPLLRGLHDSSVMSQHGVTREHDNHNHIPGQQRHGLHPPDIDVEVCVDNTRVDAVHLHTLALMKWIGSKFCQRVYYNVLALSRNISK